MTDVLIVGGGIAGVATSLALDKAGIDSTVYEAHPTGADDAGAFLTIMHNGMDALCAIDAQQLVVEASFPATTVDVYSGTGEQLATQPIGGNTVLGDRARTLKRADLYRTLQDELRRRGGRLEHGKRLVKATSTPQGEVVASFADGTTATGDLLVGADGIHSITREIIDPDAPRPRYTGLNVVYGYTRDTSIPPAVNSYRMIYGTQAFFGYTTSPEGETLWFARLPRPELSKSDLASATPERWREWTLTFFTADNTPAAQVIRSTDDNIVGVNAYDVPSTPIWHTSSMVLVGDAAHAASPAAGQGASMALEDGVVLAKCLRDLPETTTALSTYVGRRRERVERLVAISAGQGNTTSPELRKAIPQRQTSRAWLYSHHIDWNSPVTSD